MKTLGNHSTIDKIWGDLWCRFYLKQYIKFFYFWENFPSCSPAILKICKVFLLRFSKKCIQENGWKLDKFFLWVTIVWLTKFGSICDIASILKNIKVFFIFGKIFKVVLLRFWKFSKSFCCDFQKKHYSRNGYFG